jgi:predicted membrane protein
MTKELAYILQQLINVVQLSTFYVPLAVAFALIQAITRKVFLSFGDLAMFGSFGAVYICFASMLKGYEDWQSALFSLVFAILSAGAFGNVAARAVFAPMISRSAQAYMIAAIGFSIALQELMRLQSGGRDIWIPPLFQGEKVMFWSGEYRLQVPAITANFIVTAHRWGIGCFDEIFALWPQLAGLRPRNVIGQIVWRGYRRSHAPHIYVGCWPCRGLWVDRCNLLWWNQFFIRLDAWI